MYTRVALGKDSAMDVVGGESSGVQGQLLMLLPLLFGLQAWQMILGFSMFWHSSKAVLDTEGWLVRCQLSALVSNRLLLQTLAGQTACQVLRVLHVQEMERHESDLRGLRGMCIVGLMLAGMGVMNLYNTVGTIKQKFRAAAKVKGESGKKQS